MGNLLVEKEKNDPDLLSRFESLGWTEFKDGFLKDSNTEDNKKLGGHSKVSEEDSLPYDPEDQGKINLIFPPDHSNNKYNSHNREDDEIIGEPIEEDMYKLT